MIHLAHFFTRFFMSDISCTFPSPPPFEEEYLLLKKKCENLEKTNSQLVSEIDELKRNFESVNEEKELYKSIFLIKNIEISSNLKDNRKEGKKEGIINL